MFLVGASRFLEQLARRRHLVKESFSLAVLVQVSESGFHGVRCSLRIGKHSMPTDRQTRVCAGEQSIALIYEHTHKCCSTLVHNGGGKRATNSSDYIVIYANYIRAILAIWLISTSCGYDGWLGNWEIWFYYIIICIFNND